MVTVKIDSAQINGVRKAGLTVYESVSLGTQRSVRINRVRFKGFNLKENIWVYMSFSLGQTKLSL